jgi:predicted Zn-dependent protease
MVLVPLLLLFAQAQTQAQGTDFTAKDRRAQDDIAAGRFEEAVALYSELAAAVPRDSRPLVGLGTAQMGANHPELAVQPFRGALALDPGRFDVRMLLAQALSAAGRHEQAAEEYRRVTEAQPLNAKAWFALGRTWVLAAGDAYSQLAERTPPDSAYALAVTGDGLMRRLQYPSAVTAFRQALSKEPSLPSVHTALAAIDRKLGCEECAAKEEAAVAALDCSAHKLECDWVKGRYQEMATAPASRQTPAALYWRGQAFSALASQAFGKLERLAPSPELHRYRAGLHREADRRMQMVEELREALKLAPDDRDVRLDLATALVATGSDDEAYKIVRELLRAEPRSAELNAIAGNALLGLQRAGDAIPFLEKSIAADRHNLLVQWSLGRALMQAGEVKLALVWLKAAAPIDTDGTLHYLLSQAFRQTRQPALASQALAKSQELAAKSKVQPSQSDIKPK